ncbi:patatin-like protein [Burkholderia alba]|uniref:patatin-like protein n=1 Tax=Burkholderia alba TaxID=2683677 RepID=UPI002B0619CF|nr:patatin-like protein [Burkholderia alba]
MTSDNDEELRIALVMSGGVSLAVWMGGVTQEIFRLVRRQHPVYSRLLAMTRTSARVDVISGTSAGGINGAALAVALLYGGEFSELRNVWMRTATFDDLLRHPIGENPGSLLKGDEYFLPGIQSALAELARNRSTPILGPDAMPIDLRLTATLLSGRQGHHVDDLGTPVNDVDYRASFHFGRKENHDDFANRDDVIGPLARAARSSASFPFAFEPSVVKGRPCDTHLQDASGKPLPERRYVVDGGILDNKPFHGALEAMFQMPRHHGVRRVLAYVNPDPGDGPPKHPDGSMPPLSDVLTASILGIPQSQTIADQLQEIASHNEIVRHRRNNVLTLATLDPGKLAELAGSLFKVYRTRRITDAFQSVCNDLQEAKRRVPDRLMSKRGREQMRYVFESIDWDGWIPKTWPSHATHQDNSKTSWEWGLFPVEFAIKVLLDLLRIAQNLQDYAAPGVPPVLRPAASDIGENAETGTGDWSDSYRRDEGKTAAHTRRPRPRGWRRDKQAAVWTWNPDVPDSEPDAVPASASHPVLPALWQRAYAIVKLSTKQRADEQRTWAAKANAFADSVYLANPHLHAGQAGGIEVVQQQFIDMFSFLSTTERREQCAVLMFDIAGVLLDATGVAIGIVQASKQHGRLREADRSQAEALNTLASRLSATDPGEAPTQESILYRLLQFEVIEYAFNDHDSLAEDAVIELIQISGNAKSPIGGPDAAKQKLLGLQLGHFAAFYKQSWRANDWTYGRLDGAERLTRILLNPERLHRFFFRHADAAFALIKDISLDSVPSRPLKNELLCTWAKRCYARLLRAELAFLDDLSQPLPDSLPICAEIVTLRLHYGILREELPALYDAIAWDQSKGADNANASGAMLKTLGVGDSAHPFSPEQAAQRLEDGLVSSETLLGEAGSDLFTRTLAHTLATLQNTLASKAARLGPVGILFASLKLPILGFYFVANGLTHQSRTSAALNGAIFALGVLLVGLRIALDTAIPDAIATAGWAFAAYGLLMAVARIPRTIVMALAVVLLALAHLLLHVDGRLIGASLVGLFFAVALWDLFQFLAGLLMLVTIGAWSSLGIKESRDVPFCAQFHTFASWHPFDVHPCSPVMVSTAVIVGAILLASWQAMRISSRVEQRLRMGIGKTIRWAKGRMGGTGTPGTR